MNGSRFVMEFAPSPRTVKRRRAPGVECFIRVTTNGVKSWQSSIRSSFAFVSAKQSLKCSVEKAERKTLNDCLRMNNYEKAREENRITSRGRARALLDVKSAEKPTMRLRNKTIFLWWIQFLGMLTKARNNFFLIKVEGGAFWISTEAWKRSQKTRKQSCGFSEPKWTQSLLISSLLGRNEIKS